VNAKIDDVTAELAVVDHDANLTDLGNAERFVAEHGASVRYCTPRKRWLVWEGARWRWDDRGEVVRLAKTTVRRMYAACREIDDKDRREATARWALASESAQRIRAMLELAQTEPRIPVLTTDLDVDPFVLCVENGVVDLRTGKRRPHNRADMITRIVPIAYNPDARSKLWDRFLREATGGDDDLATFLQNAAGYAATGLTRERKFLFVYGRSTTGKSTFVDALRCAMGEYAADLDFDSLLQQRSTGGNRGDLVRLAGSRIAFACEVRRRARFDAKLVKAISGGDPITAAAKYEAEVTIVPTFTLMLAANDAPHIHDDDDGMWQRCLRIPFDRVIASPDPAIKAELADPGSPHAAAVLAWIVRGAVAWWQRGLAVPRAVERSTREYRDEVDVFGAFLGECCEIEPGVTTPKTTFRTTYEAWCRESGVRALSFREVAARLRTHAVEPGKSGSSRVWKGLRLSADARDTRDS
jgi:putative DNA primase/helicase